MTGSTELGSWTDEARRLDTLIEALTARSDGRSYADDLQAAVEGLESSREELRVADEEMRAQQDELDRLRAQLQNPRERAAPVLDAIPLPAALLHESASVVRANAAWAGLVGVPQTALLGKPAVTSIAVADRPRFRTVWRDLVSTGGTRRLDVCLTPRDGDRRRAHLVLSGDAHAAGEGVVMCVALPGARAAESADPFVDGAQALLSLMEMPLTAPASGLAAALAVIPAAVPRVVTATASTTDGHPPLATSDVGHRVEALQRELDEGPSLDALRRAQSTTSPRLADDPRWPRFGPAAHGLGLGCVVSTASPRSGGACLAVWGPDDAFTLSETAVISMLASGCAAVLALAELRDSLSPAAGDGNGVVEVRAADGDPR